MYSCIGMILVNLFKHPSPCTCIVDNIKAIVHFPYIILRFNTKVVLISITWKTNILLIKLYQVGCKNSDDDYLLKYESQMIKQTDLCAEQQNRGFQQLSVLFR